MAKSKVQAEIKCGSKVVMAGGEYKNATGRVLNIQTKRIVDVELDHPTSNKPVLHVPSWMVQVVEPKFTISEIVEWLTNQQDMLLKANGHDKRSPAFINGMEQGTDRMIDAVRVMGQIKKEGK